MQNWIQINPNFSRMIGSFFRDSLDNTDLEILTSDILDLAITTTKWIVLKRGYRFDHFGMSIRDVATDAIAELLAEDETGPCAPLRRFLQTTVGDSADPSVLEAHLRSIVIGTIHKNITRIFAEFDPTYAKMLRMLRIHVRKTPSISMKQAVSGYWYHRGPESEALLNLPALPPADLRTRITLPSTNGNPSVVVLTACLNYLEFQSEYRRAVSESDVMKLTLELIGSHLKAVTHESESQIDNHGHSQLLDAVETSISDTRHWVKEKYVNRGKLTPQEMEAIMISIRMYVMDSADGDPESHFHYLHQNMSGLTYDRYRSDYRNTFDYILREYFSKARTLLVSLGYERIGE